MWLLFQSVWVNGSHASHRFSPGGNVHYLYATVSRPFWGNSGCSSPRYHVTEDEEEEKEEDGDDNDDMVPFFCWPMRVLHFANQAVAGGKFESQTFVKQRFPSSEPIYRICPKSTFKVQRVHFAASYVFYQCNK